MQVCSVDTNSEYQTNKLVAYWIKAYIGTLVCDFGYMILGSIGI